jgi:hypothetical protein
MPNIARFLQGDEIRSAVLPDPTFRERTNGTFCRDQASDATIMAIAGHVSRQMLEHYSHVRMDLKRKALDGLATRGPVSEGKRISYDTNNDTTTAEESEITNRNGRGERIRTSDPLVPNQVLYQAEPLPELAFGWMFAG